MDEPTAPQAAPKAQVFLSYSRNDTAFRARLAAALESRGYLPIYDQSDRPHDDPDLRLTAQDEWWTSLKSMIAGSDVMIFVVSPESVASPVCDDEIAHARALGKRVVAVLRRLVDFNVAPERLRALNVKIDFRDDASQPSEVALDALCAELDLDIEWHRIGARLMRQADFWDKAARPEAQLLRSGAIADADAWAAIRPKGAPAPGSLLTAFLAASRDYEREHRDKQRRLIGRAFVKPAEQAMAEGRHDAALRLVAAGAVLAEDPDFSLVPELARAAARAAFIRPYSAILHHDAPVRAACFSPDSRLVVSASDDQTARVWDTLLGREIARLQGHSLSVSSANFSSDCKLVVTGSNDRTARIWDAANWTEIASLNGHLLPVNAAAFNSTGDLIVTASQDKSARIWNTATFAQVAQLEGHEHNVNTASFSPDGARVVTASDDKTARIWDVTSGAEIARLEGHSGEVLFAGFSPDGALVASASWDGVARLWNAKTGVETARLQGHGRGALFAAFSADGASIVTASLDQSARTWKTENGFNLACLLGHDNYVRTAVFSPDGGRVVTSSDDRTARIWDAISGEELTCLLGHDDYVRSAAFSPDGARVVTASRDGTARVWDTAQRTEIARLRGKRAAFSPDGGRVFAASPESGVGQTWNVSSGGEITQLQGMHGHGTFLSAVAFSPDGVRVVTAGFTRTRVWEASSGAKIADLHGDDHYIYFAAFSHDGSRIIAADRETIRIWDIKSGAEIARFENEQLVAFVSTKQGDRILSDSDLGTRVWDPMSGRELMRFSTSSNIASFSGDASRIITAKGNVARIWNVATGAEIARLQNHQDDVWSAAFSADGARLVTASKDLTVRTWDVETGAELARLRGHQDAVFSAKFSNDGSLIVTASKDKTARIWHAATGAEIASLEGHEDEVYSAKFSPCGAYVLTSSADDTSRIWDVSRTSALRLGLHASIINALRDGRGSRTPHEANDLLMQDAPEDLYSAFLALVPDRAETIDAAAAILNAPRHPNCYLSATQFAEKFGLEPPLRVPFEPTAVDGKDAGNRAVEPPVSERDSRDEDAAVALLSGRGEPSVPIDPPAQAAPAPAISEPPLTPRARSGLDAVAAIACGFLVLALIAAATFVLARFGLLSLE